MKFLIVEAETSGALEPSGSAPSAAFTFDVWLGDDLIRAYPAVLVTRGLRDALLTVPDSSGFRLSRARVRGSRFFRLHTPSRRLPLFWAVQIDGKPGRDDMGLSEGGALVVSRRILDVVLEFKMVQAVFKQYDPGRPLRRRVSRTH